MEKAWAFYRRSTDKQELSVEDQRRECQTLATKMNLEIAREFEPVKGWGSGLTIDQDPSFQEMVRLAEQGGHGVRYLLVYDVSRFGRLQPEDKIYWERRLKKQGGIQIVYSKDDFKNDGSTLDTLSKVLKHGEAHQFSMKLSETTLRGAKSHALMGHSAGGKAPYGYNRLLIDAQGNPVKILQRGEHKADKLQRVVWQPSPTERTVVQGIFERYDQGSGLNTLVKDLNLRQVPAPRGRHWCKNIVHYILRNRAYIGERIYNKRSYKGYRRGEKGALLNPLDQWVTKDGAHEPIVEKSLFERIQSRMKTRVITQGRTFQRPYLLTGLAKCGHCGYKLIGWPKGGNGHRYLTYTCGGYQRIGTSVCRSFNVLTEELEQVALETIREEIKNTDWKDEVRLMLRERINERFGGNNRNPLDDLQKSLARINQEIDHALGAVKLGRYSESLMEMVQGLEVQRNDIRRQIAEAQEQAVIVESADDLAEKVFAYADQFDRLWSECPTVEKRKEFLRTFLHQVTVDHSAEAIKATYYVYKVPMQREALAASGLTPLTARVTCGGRI